MRGQGRRDPTITRQPVDVPSGCLGALGSANSRTVTALQLLFYICAALLFQLAVGIGARGLALAAQRHVAGDTADRGGRERPSPLPGRACVTSACCGASSRMRCGRNAPSILRRWMGRRCRPFCRASSSPSRSTSRSLRAAQAGRSRAAIPSPMHRGRMPTASRSSGCRRHRTGRICHRARLQPSA